MQDGEPVEQQDRKLDEDAELAFISLSPLLAKDHHDGSSKAQTAFAMVHALRTSGFLYLTDYADVVSPQMLKDVFASSATFFRRPETDKEALAWMNARSNRGWTCPGREKVCQGMTKEDVTQEREGEGEDMKESFDIGRDDEEDYPNIWPADNTAETATFKNTMRAFFLQCKVLHRILMHGIAIGLGIDPDFFDDYVRVGDNTLRLLHYPPVEAKAFQQQRRVRAGAHSDYGSVTLLFQDETGGLQVERPGMPGQWMDVRPRDNTIVVNAGDLLARWSNDTIRSTMHRVVEPPSSASNAGHPARYSIAYFGNPDFHKEIAVIPATCSAKDDKKYPPVNSGEYLVRRLEATY